MKSLNPDSKISTNPVHIFKKVVEKSGVKGLYVGLGSGLLRQISYTTVRMGIFRTLSDYCKE